MTRWVRLTVILILAAGCRHEFPSGDVRSRDISPVDRRRDTPLLDAFLLDALQVDRTRGRPPPG